MLAPLAAVLAFITIGYIKAARLDLTGKDRQAADADLAKLERDYEKQLDDCEDGDRRACDDARDTYAEMQQIIPSIPYEPEED